VSLDSLEDVDLKRRRIVVFSDHSRCRLADLLSQQFGVELELYTTAVVFSSQAQTLAQYLLKLVAGEEEQVDHFAHWDADRLNI